MQPDEREWIENERILCTYDYLYFATRYARIQSWDASEGIIRYKPNVAQLILNDICAEQEEQQLAIMLLLLKARQLGCSTDWIVRMLHRFLFWRDTKGIEASSKEDKTWELLEKIQLALDHIPWWLKPNDLQIRTTGETFAWSDSMNTKIRAAWGNMKGGLGRGETPSCGHICELPDFVNPKEDIDSALFKALHPNPMTLLGMESTAKWVDDYWHNKWKDSVEYYPQGKAYWRPIFLPWYMGIDIYPTETVVRQYAPDNLRTTWQPQPLTRAHSLRAADFVSKWPFLQKYLGKNWRMPIEQQWFWEWEREQAKRGKGLAEWTSEMPASADEAFQIKGAGIFDAEKIAELRENAKRPLFAFAIGEPEGEYDIPVQFKPALSEIDWKILKETNEPNGIPVYAEWGSKFYKQYILYPLIVEDWNTFNFDGKLIIWEMPNVDDNYEIGGDMAEGLGQDFSCLTVLRQGGGLDPETGRHLKNEEVAQFASQHMAASDLFHPAMCIGSFYSMLRNGNLTQPKIVVENARGGAALNNQLMMSGWSNFYVYLSLSAKIKDASKTAKVGWETNEASRAECLTFLLPDIRDNEIQINSKLTITSLAGFGFNPRRRRLEAMTGCFVEGTKITLASGERKPIEEIKAGDSVLTHSGRACDVVRPFERKYDNDLVRLKVSGLPDMIEATWEHPFLVRRRTHKNIQTWQRRDALNQFPIEWSDAQDLKVGDWLAVPKRKNLSPINLSPEQLHVIGFWLAEGNLRYRYQNSGRKYLCGLTLTNKDVLALAKTERILKGWFPNNKISGGFKDGQTIPSKSFINEALGRNGVCELEFWSIPSADYFLENFGEYCDGKFISEEIYNHSNLLPLVAGFIDGDGSQRSNGNKDVNVYTTSERLAWQMRQILIDNNIWCTLHSVLPKKKGSRLSDVTGEPYKRCWVINIKSSFLHLLGDCKVQTPQDVAHCRHVLEDDDYFWTPIRKRSERNHCGPVYNMEVADDNTYVVGGVAAHNCHDDPIFSLGFAHFSIMSFEIGTRRDLAGARRQQRLKQLQQEQDARDSQAYHLGDMARPVYAGEAYGYDIEDYSDNAY